VLLHLTIRYEKADIAAAAAVNQMFATAGQLLIQKAEPISRKYRLNAISDPFYKL